MSSFEPIKPYREVDSLMILTRTSVEELSKLVGIKPPRLRGFLHGFQVLELSDINRCQKLLQDRLLDIVRTTGVYVKPNGGGK